MKPNIAKIIYKRGIRLEAKIPDYMNARIRRMTRRLRASGASDGQIHEAVKNAKS